MTALTDEQLTDIADAKELARNNYRQHRDVASRIEDVIDTLVDHCNDLARRLAEAQQHLNSVCHQRDEEAEENRDLRDEVARLTTEIEAMRAAVPAA